MTVVADTSPIISLLLIRKFDLITNLFDQFFIPQAVLKELLAHNEIASFHTELMWLKQRTIQPKHILNFNRIDYGETEAISLSLEINADLLLIDDKIARNVAEQQNIKCIGTLGVLYMAKKKGLIPSLKPLFIELINHRRFYAKSIMNIILRKAGEEEFM